MTRSIGLLDLPRELLVDILKYLDLRDLLRCNTVCPALREVIKESFELQYQIELVADGLVDGTRCTLSTSERLARLLELRARWRYLDWTGVKHISAPAMCQAYELVDGVFASSMGNGLSGSRHLALTWLPTTREEERTVEREDLGVTVRDFAIDPSQDLMALVIADEVASFNIHLRTMSENKPHPRAAKPELKAPIPFQVGNSFIQIVDDIVGTFFWVHGPGLLIWNWRTGKNVVHCIGFDLPTGAYDFAFLSSRAFMLTVAAGAGSIELYTFTGDEDALITRDSRSPSFAARRLPTRVAVLLLPPTNIGRDLRKAFTHSGPFVAQPTRGRPFETSEDVRIHMLTLHYGDLAGMFNMFLQNRFLLSLVPPGVGSRGNYAHVVKPWEEWGPENTRVFEWSVHFHWLRCVIVRCSISHLWNRYIHGSRVVFPPIPERDPNAVERVILMMDFNVHPKRINDPVDEYPVPEDRDCLLITNERRIEAGSVFQQPVVSRLPYLASTRGGITCVADYSGFMIDHERLIGMRVSASAASHVLGDNSVVLGAGDLNIIPSSGSDLMLTVGSAAFKLHKDTPFGTLEGDQRAYVFSPEIEGVTGGFVKVTLPEGVTEDGSRLSELQTKFEEVLISHGLLQPGGEGAAERVKQAVHLESEDQPLISIPGVIAAQVLNEETTVLSEGTLSLILMPKSDQHSEPVLTLTVGKAAFPLYKSTTFIAIVLPASPGSLDAPVDLAELQNQLELILIHHGLLKDGFEAAADEVARSVREDSARTAQRIRDVRDLYLSTHPRTTQPAQLSTTTHYLADGTAEGTQALADVAHRVSGAVFAGAASAGAWIASTFVPTEKETTEHLSAAARGAITFGDGVAAGVGEVKDAAEDAAGTAIENDYGEEAREVAGNVGHSVGNVGAAAGDVVAATSGGPIAIAGLKGAATRQEEEQKAQDEGDS
ncbi:hypothetical protein L226DRAFT_469953 [Lentinus tigrinus ALCF2SS1-7]|uniref:F-box domain-containing protein n=1 Tax=Lentinus tigrinus ALCF2SS1-6 TaxID=1328759 RepID=A0A5C2RSJ1_9APHY|nr:hypothetical protein L227DRAFT_512519 [Lentinus tigrinus ALCF2SS1-6]RPD70618.1 hypothetical protein L226DRAFT_469953 [Lentinus tigrinus ALCF2SS1-7]